MEQPVLPPEARVLNLLDVLPDGFIPLSRVTLTRRWEASQPAP